MNRRGGDDASKLVLRGSYPTKAGARKGLQATAVVSPSPAVGSTAGARSGAGRGAFVLEMDHTREEGDLEQEESKWKKALLAGKAASKFAGLKREIQEKEGKHYPAELMPQPPPKPPLLVPAPKPKDSPLEVSGKVAVVKAVASNSLKEDKVTRPSKKAVGARGVAPILHVIPTAPLAADSVMDATTDRALPTALKSSFAMEK